MRRTIYHIEALVYERVNLMLESGGIIKTIKLTVEKTDEGLKNNQIKNRQVRKN